MPFRSMFVLVLVGVLLASCSSTPEPAAAAELDRNAAGSFRQAAALSGDQPARVPGAAVAVDGDWALAGAPGSYPDGTGSVYVYHRSADGSWRQEALLAAPDGADWNFGRAVALSGSLAAVADGSSVYLFGLNGGASREILTGVRVRSLALSGDTLAVGVLAGADQAPAVRVFARNQGGPGAWGSSATLQPQDAGFDFTYRFGASLGLSGDGRTLIVSNSGDADQYYEHASAVIYTRDAGGWALAAVLTPPNDPSRDAWDDTTFGWTVDVDEGVAVVGSLPVLGESSSDVYVYEQDAGHWRQTAHWTLASPGDAEASPLYTGRSVAVAGSTILAGAYAAGCMREGGDEVPCGAGALSVYRKNERTGSWEKTQELQAKSATPDQQFAQALAFDGQTAVVGARKPADGTAPTVFVFER